MITSFRFWTCNPFHPTVRLKETYESWPMTLNDPVDEVSGFARDYAMRWRDDPDFPDHPFRDRAGNIILPDSIDQEPVDYVTAHEPPASTQEQPVLYPFSGPANIVRGPATDARTIAAYERSRRGLGKSVLVKKPPEPYEAPLAPAKGHTPSFTPNDPKIPPRVYSRDKFDPKYQKPGANGNG